jgi:hypothetical protein
LALRHRDKSGGHCPPYALLTHALAVAAVVAVNAAMGGRLLSRA